MPSYFNDPLITIKQQAPSAMFILDNSEQVQITDSEAGYADFTATSTTEKFYSHPNLTYCSSHTIGASGVGTLDINFYAGDTIIRSESLQGARETFLQAGVTKIGFKTESSTAIVRSWSQDRPISSDVPAVPEEPTIFFTNTREGTDNPTSFLRMFTENSVEVSRFQYGYSLNQLPEERDLSYFQEDTDNSSAIASTYDSGADLGFVPSMNAPTGTAGIVDAPAQIMPETGTPILQGNNFDWFSSAYNLATISTTDVTSGLAVETSVNEDTGYTNFSTRFFDVNTTEDIFVIQTGWAEDSTPVTFAHSCETALYKVMTGTTIGAQATFPVNQQVTDKLLTGLSLTANRLDTGAAVTGERIYYTVLWARATGAVVTYPQIRITNETNEQTVEFFNANHARLVTIKMGTVLQASAASDGDNAIAFDSDMPKLNYTIYTTPVSTGTTSDRTISNPYLRAIDGFSTYVREQGLDEQSGFDWIAIDDDEDVEEVGVVFTGTPSPSYPNNFLRIDKDEAGGEAATLQYGFNDHTALEIREIPVEPVVVSASANTIGYVSTNTYLSTIDIVTTTEPALTKKGQNKDAPLGVIDASTAAFVADAITYLATEIEHATFKSGSGSGLGVETATKTSTFSQIDYGFVRIFDRETDTTLVVIQQVIQNAGSPLTFAFPLADEDYVVCANAFPDGATPTNVRINQKNVDSVEIEVFNANTGLADTNTEITANIFWATKTAYTSEYMKVIQKTSATAGTNQTLEFFGVDQAGLIASIDFGEFPNGVGDANTITFNDRLPTTEFTVQNTLIGPLSTTQAERQETINCELRQVGDILVNNKIANIADGQSGFDWLVMWALPNTLTGNDVTWTNTVDPLAGTDPNVFLNFLDDDGTPNLIYRLQYGYNVESSPEIHTVPYVANTEIPSIIYGTYNPGVGVSSSNARGMTGKGSAVAGLQDANMAIYVTGDPTDPSEDVFTYSINSNKLTGDFTSPVQPQGLGVKVLTTGSDNLKQRITYIEYFDQSDSSKKLVIMSGQATHDTVLGFPVALPDTDYVILLSQDTTDAGVSNRLVSTAYRIKTNASFTPFMYDTGETAVDDDLAITFFVVWAVTSFDSDTLRISTDSEGHRRIEFHAVKDDNDIHELISTWTYDEVPDSQTTGEHTIIFPQGYPSTDYHPFATPILASSSFQFVSFTNVVERNVDSMKTSNINKTTPTGNFYGFSWLVIENSQLPDAETLSFTNRPNGAVPNNDFLRALAPDSTEVYNMQKGSGTQGGVAPVGTPFETSGLVNINFNLMHVATKNQTANPFVYNSGFPLSLSPMVSTILFKNPSSAFVTVYDGTFFFDIHTINWRDTQTLIGTNTSLDITSAEADASDFERNYTGSLRYYESGSGDDIFVMQQLALNVTEGTVTVTLPYAFPGGTTDYNIIVNNAAIEGNNVMITPIVVPGSLTETDFELKVRNQQTGDAIDNDENRTVITIYWARSTAFVNEILEVVPVGDDRAVFFYGAEQEGRVALLQFGKSEGLSDVTFPEEQPSTDYSPATTAEGTSNQLTSQVGANFAATMSFVVYDDEVVSDDDLYWSTWYVRPV